MACTRIVSLLPSATEIICELGAAGALRGITHGCPQPPGGPAIPRVISPLIDATSMGGAEIDAEVRRMRRAGCDMFALDEDALRRADPDLVVCQNTCEACAPYAAQVRRALEVLGGSPAVHSVDPHGLGGILDSVTDLAALLGRDGEGLRLRRSLESRMRAIRAAAALAAEEAGGRQRVLALEWIDPPYTAGHWVPEMIGAAGGESLLSSAGDHSRRMEFGEAGACGPDVAVIMPCGFDAQRAATEYDAPGAPLAADPRWQAAPAARAGRVYAVDAGGYFSKPSIRTVDGIAILANVLWPGASGLPPAPRGSYMRLHAGPPAENATALPPYR